MINFLKLAVKNRLASQLFGASKPFPANSGEVNITGNGMPTTPHQGYVFFAVHGGTRICLSRTDQYHLHERYDFTVTISLKSAHAPRFRAGDLIISNAADGVELFGEFVVQRLHGNLSVWSEANTLLSAAGYNAKGNFLSTFPTFLSGGPAIDRTGSWFGATIDDKGGFAGVSYELRFAGVELIRYIGDLSA